MKCLLDRHEPDRMRVFIEQDGYYGTCKACGKSLMRRDRNLWVADPLRRALKLAQKRGLSPRP